jgi:DNA-binding response OmpR family regulator
LFPEKKIIVSLLVTTVAIDIFENENFDIVFLDENMPGMSGLETLSEMKEKILRSDDYDHQK